MTSQALPVAPILVFGWGNLSRGDDALGPMLVDRLRVGPGWDVRVDYLDDYQLQVEHALDLAGRQRVLFVDASLRCQAPFEVTRLQARRDASFSTHAMSPQAVMQVFRDLQGIAPPPCTLLAIRGRSFEFGDPPQSDALVCLEAALRWAHNWLVEDPAAELAEAGHA